MIEFTLHVQFSNSIGPDGMSAIAKALNKITGLKVLGLVNAYFQSLNFIIQIHL